MQNGGREKDKRHVAAWFEIGQYFIIGYVVVMCRPFSPEIGGTFHNPGLTTWLDMLRPFINASWSKARAIKLV